MSALINTYKVYIIAFLLCALGVVSLAAYLEVTYLQRQLTEANEKITKLETANKLLTAANQQMSKDIETQNNAVDAMKKAEDRRTADAEKALAEVVTERNKWRDRYAVLFGTSPVGADTCQSMTALITRYYGIRMEEVAK